MTHSHYVNPVGLSGGLALWRTDAVNVLVSTSQFNLIQTVISSHHSRLCWNAFFIYGPLNRELRRNFLHSIAQIINSIDAPVRS